MIVDTFNEGRAGHRDEDVVDHRRHPEDGDFVLCALADGQGGQSGGAMAARVAVTSALDSAIATSSRDLLMPSTWVDLCGRADREVAGARDAGYCSLVALIATPEWVVGASSGDSTAILLFETKAAVLTERQRKHPAVGSGGAILEPFSAAVDGWWRVVVASDGVWKYVGRDAIIAIGRNTRASDVAPALRHEAVSGCGGMLPDDFSLIVIEASQRN